MTETTDWYCSTLICVDDEPSVLESYRRILSKSADDDEMADILAMAEARAGESAGPSTDKEGVTYNLLLAESGPQAIQLVKAELAAGRRVAAGFFDMRMPGMDGFETISELRKLDPNLLCAVVTAYTDRSVTQIREIFTNGRQDELLYFKKPFSPEELAQSALNMMSSWNRKRKIEEHVRAIEKHKRGLSQILHAVSVLSGMPPHSLQYLMHGFLFQMLAFMEAEHGCSVFWDVDGTQKISYGVGRFEDREDDLHDFIKDNPKFQDSLDKNRCYILGGQCFMPLVSESHQMGGVYIESKNSLEKLVDLNLLEVFKSQMIQLIMNSLFHHQVLATEEEALTDPLTGLYNRRFFQKRLNDSLRHTIVQARKLAVLMVDLDDFKQINDTYGHEAGDFVLKRIGNILRITVRDYDLVGRNIKEIGETGQYAIRYGGEEFCLILMNTGYLGALQVAERLRANIESHEFSMADTHIRVTASIGVFSRDVSPEESAHEDLMDEFIALADKALYKAKAAGKNQVVSCQGDVDE